MDKNTLSRILQQDVAGFRHIDTEARRIKDSYAKDKCFELAREMYDSNTYQDRMFAVQLLGYIAPELSAAFDLLQDVIPKDDNWRVQEMLARSFDYYCKTKGYEQSLDIIRAWLAASHPNQRRAASEGLRIWTSRPYFDKHPEIAIGLLSSRKDDESEYVRKSIGNALRDISKQFPELIEHELNTWDRSRSVIAFTYALAVKFISSNHKNES